MYVCTRPTWDSWDKVYLAEACVCCQNLLVPRFGVPGPITMHWDKSQIASHKAVEAGQCILPFSATVIWL